MGRERYLVALVVPPPVATEVDGLRRALGDRARRRIPAHVTLVPPVNVNDDRLPEGLAVLRAAAAATGPLRLRLGPVTTFAPANPVVYLAVGGDTAGLAALRDRVFRPPWRRKVTHEFTPHVTIGRPPPERIAGAVAALAHYDAEVTVDWVHLFREEPGHLWVPVTDARFGAPAVVGRGGLPLEVATSALPPPDAAALLGPPAPAAPGAGAGPAPAAPGGGRPSDAPGEGSSGAPAAGGPEAAGPGVVPFAVTARRDDDGGGGGRGGAGGGDVVGVAVGRTVGPVAQLAWLAVAEGSRRQGIGRHLLLAVEATARARSCTVALAAAPATPAARALLAGNGWRATGPPLPGTAGDGGAPGRGRWERWERLL